MTLIHSWTGCVASALDASLLAFLNLLAGVSGGFSRGSPIFAEPTDWPVSHELK